MARKIVVDPAKLETVAKTMDGHSAEYQRLYDQLFNEVKNMGNAWKGQDNVAYTTQIEGFRDDFDNMKKLMEQYSGFLKQSATTYKETQTDIVSAAKRLTN
ncbi:WXG100 family type VII secretion target [Paenibacillus sp. N1-5-1-14]|uniref:WXG100 family type VII secretion target n=1 Tax=Paenibacillus radicibacter TaxID=2972488 RepID=UPI002159135E|nr:WXG100 family type VII secretion target [Paenibacillus radicibacter]MCR8643645.1 WXG100 family type VII secretion target [Paenibacillus radicibacter]MCR8644755.1 WXG100 family type VII secretion target [Paenibacillus radicibacter]